MHHVAKQFLAEIRHQYGFMPRKTIGHGRESHLVFFRAFNHLIARWDTNTGEGVIYDPENPFYVEAKERAQAQARYKVDGKMMSGKQVLQFVNTLIHYEREENELPFTDVNDALAFLRNNPA